MLKSLIIKQKGLFLGPLALFEGGVANSRRICAGVTLRGVWESHTVGFTLYYYT